ncbi:MAG: adenylate/guanylate cyclase domain-containing protein [Acidimicrobiales bacterium]
MTNEYEQTDLVPELIIGRPKYTAEEVAGATGMSADDAERLWIELGFPAVDPEIRHFTDADIEVLQTVRDLQASWAVDPQVVLSMTRVLGQALSRVAYAQAENLETVVAPGDSDSGHPRLELSEQSLEVANHLLFDGKFERFLSYAWRRHLAEAVRQRLVPRSDTDEIVGFADLVGYSSLTSRMDPQQLPDLIARFERAAYQHVSQAGGRVIKLIGDAAMFMVPNPTAAAIAALGLRAATRNDPSLPSLRIGMAWGPVVAIEGDLFGDTVNRASRLTDICHPGTVLVDDGIGHALNDEEDVVVRALRPRKLKGIGYVRAWVLRPVDTGED